MRLIKSLKNMSFRRMVLLDKVRRVKTFKKHGLAMNIFELDYLPEWFLPNKNLKVFGANPFL